MMDSSDLTPEENMKEVENIQDPNTDVISLVTFHSSNSQLLNTISLPLAKVPTSMLYEETGYQVPVESSASSAIAIASADTKKSSNEDVSKDIPEKPQEDLDDIPLQDPPYTCFSKGQIILVFAIVMFIGFLGPMAGNIYIPALPLLQREFHVGTTTINSTVSVFMAVFSVGPLFWGMFADFAGRKFLYISSLLLLVIVNLLLAVLPANIAVLYTLRVFQAFGSSSVIALGTGTVTDITPPKHRGKAIAYFMMGPNMGPILAPIISGLILVKGDHWRWLFGFVCIMSGIALLIVITLLPETLRCIIGNGDQRWVSTKEKDSDMVGDAVVDIEQSQTLDNVQRPRLKLCSNLGIQKPVNNGLRFQALYPKPPKPTLRIYWQMIKFLPLSIASISTALLFAGYYAFSVTFAHFLQTDYHLSMLGVGAAYVCPGVAMLIGSQTGGHLSDFLRKRWVLSHEGQKFPLEYRLILQIWAILINTAGCIGYGWSIHRHYHIAVVLVFSALNAFGLTWCSNTTMTYLSELMNKRTAGAIAVSSFFRNIGATISSAIIQKLCSAMGVGWCFTGLGVCNIFSLLAIMYLIRFGSRWQEGFKV